jgi:hypothetical protein
VLFSVPTVMSDIDGSVLLELVRRGVTNSTAVVATSRYLLSIVTSSAELRYTHDPGEPYIALLLFE